MDEELEKNIGNLINILYKMRNDLIIKLDNSKLNNRILSVTYYNGQLDLIKDLIKTLEG